MWAKAGLANTMERNVLALLWACCIGLMQVTAHHACLPGYHHVLQSEVTSANGLYCTEPRTDPDGMCCNVADEDLVKASYEATLPANPTNAADCQALHQRVSCVACYPWAYHLYQAADSPDPTQRQVLLSPTFCSEYAAACNLPAGYCAEHFSTEYSYPDEVKSPDGARTGDGFTKYFTDAEDTSIMRDNRLRGMAKVPGSGNPGYWYIWQGQGKIYKVKNTPTAKVARAGDVTLVWDLTSKVIQRDELSLQYVAFSPDWLVSRCFYVTYNDKATTDLKLARLCFNSDGTQQAQETLMTIDRDDNSQYHNGGWIGFAKSDLQKTYSVRTEFNLLMSVGDCQRSNKVTDLSTPYGKMLRTRVKAGTAGLLPNPTDNPWYDANAPTNMAGKVWAYGLRNPYRCSTDPDIWCGDVGEAKIEKIIKIERKNFYGWPTWEGTRCRTEYNTQAQCDAVAYTKPIFQWCHTMASFTSEVCSQNKDVLDAANAGTVGGGDGGAATGGTFYYGLEFADRIMGGAYIFGDYQKQAIMMMKLVDGKWKKYTLYTGVEGPLKVVGFFPDPNTGDIFVVDVPGGATAAGNTAGLGQITKLGCGEQCNTPNTNAGPSPTPTPTPGGAGVPDPGCSRGIKHPNPDNKTCCSAQCKDATGKSICGTSGCGSTGKGNLCCGSQITALNKQCVTADAPCSNYILADPKCTYGLKHPSQPVCCPYTCRDATGKSICGASGCGSTGLGAQCCGSQVTASNKACANNVEPCAPYSTARTLNADWL
eukprot:TRINITY_DN6781_c0_g4_i1.p1 TRINITY_DN6781_c0_g4~~TRINITY_DN6781_c0_g4_i1.p1  ORF type:complete len:764 (+),score=182.84 TRINITY_DN6781_c0_g4_i1:500-2791(+)